MHELTCPVSGWLAPAGLNAAVPRVNSSGQGRTCHHSHPWLKKHFIFIMILLFDFRPIADLF